MAIGLAVASGLRRKQGKIVNDEAGIRTVVELHPDFKNIRKSGRKYEGQYMVTK